MVLARCAVAVYGVPFGAAAAVAEVPSPFFRAVVGVVGEGDGEFFGEVGEPRQRVVVEAEGVTGAAVQRPEAVVGEVGYGFVVEGIH